MLLLLSLVTALNIKKEESKSPS